MLPSERVLPHLATLASNPFRTKIEGLLAVNDRAALAELVRRSIDAYRSACASAQSVIEEERETRERVLSALEGWARQAEAEERGEDWTRGCRGIPDNLRKPNAERARRLYVAALYDLRNVGIKRLGSDARVERCSRMLQIVTDALGKCVGSARGVGR